MTSSSRRKTAECVEVAPVATIVTVISVTGSAARVRARLAAMADSQCQRPRHQRIGDSGHACSDREIERVAGGENRGTPARLDGAMLLRELRHSM